MCRRVVITIPNFSCPTFSNSMELKYQFTTSRKFQQSNKKHVCFKNKPLQTRRRRAETPNFDRSCWMLIEWTSWSERAFSAFVVSKRTLSPLYPEDRSICSQSKEIKIVVQTGPHRLYPATTWQEFFNFLSKSLKLPRLVKMVEFCYPMERVRARVISGEMIVRLCSVNTRACRWMIFDVFALRVCYFLDHVYHKRHPRRGERDHDWYQRLRYLFRMDR